MMADRGKNRPNRIGDRPGFPLIFFCIGLFSALAMLFAGGVLFRIVFKLERVVADISQARNETAIMLQMIQREEMTPTLENTCDFPFVYNKPHKTGSTKIRKDIIRWARDQERRVFRCSGYIKQATFQMRECISKDLSGCAIVATHVVMSPVMREILQEKIGKYKLVTSTRNPKKRILSSFLQVHGTKARRVTNATDLNRYLRKFNPWSLYNYHTGENRVGKCPMKEEEKLLLHDMVNAADVVIDVDLFNVSQAILKYEKLFPLTDSVANVGSSSKLVLEPKTKDLLRTATCVEDEIHSMYRKRMASVYEKATGKPCLSNSRKPTDCFDELYAET